MIFALTTFTWLHVGLSLIGIFAGFIVAFGLLAAKRLDGWTALFLLATVLTTVTGFLFSFHGVTPAQRVGLVSLVALLIAIFARYGRKLVGAWRWIYVVTAMLALYLNVFVLIVQSFEKLPRKLPALNAFAPPQTQIPFLVAQVCAFVFLLVLTILAAKNFRPA